MGNEGWSARSVALGISAFNGFWFGSCLQSPLFPFLPLELFECPLSNEPLTPSMNGVRECFAFQLPQVGPFVQHGLPVMVTLSH